MNDEVDVLIVGAGFGGMYMLHKVRELGLSAQVFEAGDGVGGTWYWNRYPGARCDVESLEYSYSFDAELQQEWKWSERYTSQPEILEYANHVADRFDLRRDIEFSTRVEHTHWNEATNRWGVSTDTGRTCSAQFVVMATGCLSSANVPDFPGIDDFAGEVYHTGRWPHEGVDFAGKRVGVIGTGSSGIQSIPVIAEQCADLTVFQRTPNYSIPAHNGSIDSQYEAEVKADYAEFRDENRQMNGGFGARSGFHDEPSIGYAEEERRARFEQQWQRGGFAFMRAFNDLMIDDTSNATARAFVRDKIAAVVDDPETAALLTPVPTQVIGCKRICLDTYYFETYNHDHVHLVDVSTAPIETFTPTGLRTGGVEYDFDCVVLATGFDAMTGTLTRIDIRGVDDEALTDAWSAGPVNYLGLQVPGFPNLFTITGPGSPSVLTNMIVAIEHHVEWISDCIEHLAATGLSTISAAPDAAATWVDHVNDVADMTLMPTCNSWYLGANIPGKTRVFMPLIGLPPYAEKCTEVAQAGYEGFILA